MKWHGLDIKYVVRFLVALDMGLAWALYVRV